MSNNKEEEFNCSKCGIEIGGHNQYLHDGMCDDCFFKEYFPEDAQVFETDIDEIKARCRSNPIKRDNQKFWEFLKSDEFDQKRFKKIVKEVTEKIDCTKCSNCCKELKPVLSDEDAERVSKQLGCTKEDFISKYLIRNNDNELEIKQMPCAFLAENKCRIYDARPENCKGYPNIDKDVTTRCHQFFSNAEICPIVYNVLENAKEEFLEDIYAFENPDI